MAIAQSDFNLFHGKAYEGQRSTIEQCEVLSRTVEGGLIPFGRAVINGADTHSCAPVDASITADQIVGFTVRSMSESSPTSPTNTGAYETGYAVGKEASILIHGPLFMMCVDGASKGDTVGVIVSAGENQGRLTKGATAGAVELNQIKWVEDVAAGEIGEIRVHGIFNV